MSSILRRSLSIIKNSFSKMFHHIYDLYQKNWKERNFHFIHMKRYVTFFTYCRHMHLLMKLYWICYVSLDWCCLEWRKIMKSDQRKKTLASYRFEMDKVNLEWWVRFIRVQLLWDSKDCGIDLEDLMIHCKWVSIFRPHDWAALDLFVI